MLILLLLFTGLAALAEPNYVYHEATTNTIGCGGFQYRSVLTPNSSQSITIGFKLEFASYWNQARIYYTTDGSNPSGAFGTVSGTTQVVNATYQCGFGSPNVSEVVTGVIPAQPAGTVVKYIVSAWHTGGGNEIFANGPGTPCGGCGTITNSSSLATVFTYTVGVGPIRVTSTGGTASPSANYATLAAAITAINGGTLHTGTINCYVDAGYTETAPAGGYQITTTTGTLANPIIFQKSGVGANPLITAGVQTAGSYSDGIIKIIGGDYITITGFTLQENASNSVTATGATNTMTEFGIGLFPTATGTTDGAQNNTIQNNTITLNSAYGQSMGIFSTSRSKAAAITTTADATTTAGTNSNNKFYGNTISNVALGMYFISPPVTTTVMEINDIGGSSASTGNTITFGSTSAPGSNISGSSGTYSAGIMFRSGVGSNVRFNTITSNNISYANVSGGVLGVFYFGGGTLTSGTYTSNCSNNTITLFNTGVTPVTGIDFGSGLSTGTITASTNTISINSGSTAANSSVTTGIKASYTSSASTISSNNISINHSGSGSWSGTVYFINASGASGTMLIQSNILQSTGNHVKTTGAVYGISHDASISTNLTVGGTAGTANSMNIISSGSGSAFTGIYSNGSTATGIGTYSVSNNSITVAGLAGAATAFGINNLDGGAPAKLFNNNNISITGTNTGATSGITLGYSGTGANISTNTITISNASTAINGIGTATNAAGTINGNTISVASSGVTPTINAINATTGSGPFTVTGNNITSINASAAAGSAPVINAINLGVAVANSASGNTITGITTGAGSGNATITGINITTGSTTNVFKNKIYDLATFNTGTATLISGIRIQAGTTNNIYNNYIGQGNALTGVNNADAVRAINITSTTASSTQNIYYNTVYLNSSSTGANFGSTGIYHTISTTSTTSALNLRNNIVVNTSAPAGTGLTVAYRRSGGAANNLANYASTSNNNLLYAGTPGAANLIYSDGTGSAQTMAAYKAGVFTAGTISPRDQVSLTENPPFLSTAPASSNYLHINTTIPTQVESGGTAISGDDYDGDTRNATTPDIGADEFAGIPADFSAPVISYTALSNTCATTNITLSGVTITDVSGVPLSGGNVPRIYYKKGVGGSWFSQPGTNTGGTATNGTWSFTINNADMGGVAGNDVIYYYIIAQDIVTTPNVGSNPSAGLVATGVNSVTTHPTSPNSYTITPTLSGLYTVGSGGDYATLTAAVAAYNNSCLGGAVTFNLIDAAYSGSETFPISINVNANASAINTLTIKPAATAAITGSVSSGGLIRLNGADYITIDGSNSGGTDRSLTITNSATVAPTAVSIQSLGTGAGATNNTIKNLNISTGVATTKGFGISVGTSTPGTGGADNDNTTIQNNNITVATVPVYAAGTASSSTGGLDNLLITGNTLNTTNTTLANIGLQLGYALNSSVQLNTITVSTSVSDEPVGISLETGFVSSEVSRNNITQVYTSATGGYGGRGITIGTGTTNSALIIANNMIAGVNGSNWSGFDNSSSMGIAIGALNSTNLTTTAGGISLYYNSVNMAGSYSSTTNCLTAALYIGTGASALNIRNNIFANSLNNTGTGTGSKAYAIYSAVANTAFAAINYNDYYTAGTQGVPGFISSDRTTLAAIQTGFGSNANSLNTDPQFISATNLHLSPSSPLESTATPIAGITVDNDGDARNATTPDMGADEFTGAAATVPNCATPVAPANAASGLCQPIAFNWTAPSGGTPPTGYKFYLGTDGGGTVTPTNQVNGTNLGNVLTNSVNGLLPATTYYWQIIPTNAVGDATGCTIWSFTTSSSALETITPISDDFESCPEWTIVNHTTNQWITGTATGNTGKSIYISNNGGTSNAYTNTSQTSHFYRDVTFPAGQTIYNFTFDLKSYGESGWDRLLVYIAPTSVTPVAGTPASNTTTLSGATLIYTQATYTASPGWVNVSVPLTTAQVGNTAADATRRIIFTWQNDGTTTGQPPAAIDNVNITSTAPAPIVIGTITATQQTGNVYQSSTNNNIVRISIPATGTVGTQTLTSLKVTSANINDADIAAAGVTLWTGTAAAPTTQIGTAQSFAAGSATFSGLSTSITAGTTYLWVRYNISATATGGNTVDAVIAAGDITITAAGGATAAGSQPAAPLDPAGNRPIVPALCGTSYTINNTLPTGGLNYNSFTDAINDLNLKGVSCAVVFNVKDGQTFNELTPELTATGTAVNTITFQRDNSTGTRPTLSGTGGIGTLDAVFSINTSDYITWDGINITDNAANSTGTTQMEAGIYVFAGTTANGCKNNTFKNFNITLRNITAAGEATVGVQLDAGPTSAGGANDNNKFYNVQVSNATFGYDFYNGTGTPYDSGNEINILSGGTSTIANIGNTSTTASYGVWYGNQTNLVIKNTTISNIVAATSGIGYGIYAYSGNNNTADIQNNTISDISITGTNADAGGIVLLGNAGSTIASGNTIKAINSGGYESDGIYITRGQLTATNNIIGGTGTDYIRSTRTGGASYGIYAGSNVTTPVITGNTITGITVNGGGGAWVEGIYVNSPNANISNNTLLSFVTNGNSSLTPQYGIELGVSATNATVNNNTINGISCSNDSYVFGIYANNDNATVNNNNISNITSSAGGWVWAMYLNAANQTANNNIVYKLSSSTGNVSGIVAGNPSSNTTISNNRIRNFTVGSTASSKLAGAIAAFGSGTNNITKNVIDSISNSSTTGAFALAIRTDGANSGTFNIVNNMISYILANGADNAAPCAVRGISVENGGTARVYHNTVYFTGTGTNAAMNSAPMYYAAVSGTLDMRNNIFYNNYAGTGKRSAIYANITNANFWTRVAAASNNNLLYAGAPGANNNILTATDIVQQTITNYTTAGGAKETNSFTVPSTLNMPFVNIATSPFDLHIDVTQNGLCSLDARGVAITTPITVTDDIDADARQTPPDVGADEFTLPDPLAGSIAASANPVCLPAAITLTGSGQSTGSDFYYQWQVNTGSGYTDLANGGVYAGVTTAVLTISDATGLNGYKYQLLVKRCSPASKTVATNEITLTVSTASNVASAALNASPAASCAGTSVTLTQSGGTLGTGAVWQWYTDAAFATTVGGQLTAPDASLTVAPTVTTTYYLRAINGTAPCAATVAVTGSVTVTVTPGGQWIGPATGGDWNVAANWCGGVPTAITNVVIPSWAVVDIKSADAVASSVTIQGPTGGINMMGTYNLGITSGGSITNAGVLNATAGTGAVIFNGTGTVNGTITFKNVIINGGVDFGTATTIGAGGSLNIVGGGFVNNNAPTYDCSSTLIYNTSNTYGRNLEWGTATSGKGYPGNVRVTGNTTLNYPNGSTAGRSMCGNLTIDAGSALYMDYGGTNPTAPLTVGGNVTLNGSMSFSNAAGGDLNIAGNWTRGAAGNLYPNNRAVVFNGTATQTITRSGGGTEDAFAYMIVNKTSNNVVLSNSPATAVNLTAATGDVLQLLNGNLDLNGQAFRMNNNGGNIKVSGAVRTITGAAGSTLFINGDKTITAASGGTLVTDVNVKIENNAALDFGANLTTVNGTLQLNSGSFVNANAPFYGNASLLVYNAGGVFPYNRRVEWSGTVPGGVGYPNDVLVTNNTTLQPGGNTSPTDFRNIAFNARRNVTINAGSAIYMDATGLAMNVPLKVGGNLTISGALSASSVAGGDVYVSGNWVRTGTFTANDRAVFFDGNTNATITATGGQTFDYAYLSKTGATLQLLDDVTIIKELGPQSGTLDLAAKNITIRSTAANTASVSAVGADITYGTGRFIIERYISFPRKWQLLSVPAKTTQSIFDAWQDGGSSTTVPTGYGVQITGPGPIAGTGLDAVSVSASMKYQTGVTTSFTGITQTNTTGSLANVRGYYLYVYGNRSSTANITTAAPTTLRTTGRLFIGTTGNADMPATITQPAVLGDNISVGNPLPSAIDFTALKAASANIAFNYKVWDPSQSGTYGSGIYQTIVYATGGIATPGNGSIYNNTSVDHRFIQSGQAFYVQAAGTGNVVVPFTESMKASGSRLVNRGSDPHDYIDPAAVSMISAMLHGSDGRLYDGNRVVLDNIYSNDINDDDANKIMNDGINFGNTRFGKTMAVEARSRLAGGDTIQYHMTNTFAGQYQLRFAMQNVNEPLLQAELVDRFTNTRTPVSLTDSSFINISITADAASRANNRFYLVFKQTTVVPVTFVGISAARQADRSIAVKWQVQNEVNIARYEVERSADGVHFNGILQADALNSSTYTKTDIAPLAADNFYRIKAIGISGEVIYSAVVKVAPDKQPALIAVTPNPVKDKQLAIRFVKQPAGAYALQLSNGLGQVIYKGMVTVNAGAEVKTIPLHPKTATGSYQLSIRNKAGELVYSETILIE